MPIMQFTLLSLKESQDVQESFRHLEAWYDENVSCSWPRQLVEVVQYFISILVYLPLFLKVLSSFTCLGVYYWSKSLSKPVEWRCQVLHQSLCLHFLTPGWKEALWEYSVSPKSNTTSLINKSSIKLPHIPPIIEGFKNDYIFTGWIVEVLHPIRFTLAKFSPNFSSSHQDIDRVCPQHSLLYLCLKYE